MAPDDLIFKTFSIDGIPVISGRKNNFAAGPLMIFLHAFRDTKEFFIADMKFFSQHGFFTISLDNRNHGERNEVPFDVFCKEDGRFNIVKVRSIVNTTSYDVPLIISHLARDFTFTKICLYGVSLGGFIAFKALTLDDRIDYAALFLSSPYWDDIPSSRFFLNNEAVNKELKSFAEQNSPVQRKEILLKKKILLQIGTEDQHFNIEKLKEFVSYMKASNSFDYFEYPVRHEVTDEMKTRANAWILEKLS